MQIVFIIYSSKCRAQPEIETLSMSAEGNTNDKSRDRTFELFVHENRSVQVGVRSHEHARTHPYVTSRRGSREPGHCTAQEHPDSSCPSIRS